MRTILLGAVAAIALGASAMAQTSQGGGQGGGAQAQPPIMKQPAAPGAGGQRMQGGAEAPRATAPDSGVRRDDAAQRQPMDQGGQRQGQAADSQREQPRMNTGEAAGQGAKDRPAASGNIGSRTRINITSPRQKTVIKSNIVRSSVTLPPGISIAVGTVLPSTIAFQPVPAAIVAEIPELEPYYYVVVDGQVVFVDPGTYEIVYVMPLA
jgi:hypothetical protein